MIYKEIKTPRLLAATGLCLVVAIGLAYFAAPRLLRTQTINDETITIGENPKQPGGATNVNTPPRNIPRRTTPPETVNGAMCAQVITPAKNPETQEIRDFPTPCDVPEGWKIIPR